MIRRPPRSTHCISSAASDVYKRQIPTRLSTNPFNKKTNNENNLIQSIIENKQTNNTQPNEAGDNNTNNQIIETLKQEKNSLEQKLQNMLLENELLQQTVQKYVNKSNQADQAKQKKLPQKGEVQQQQQKLLSSPQKLFPKSQSTIQDKQVNIRELLNEEIFNDEDILKFTFVQAISLEGQIMKTNSMAEKYEEIKQQNIEQQAQIEQFTEAKQLIENQQYTLQDSLAQDQQKQQPNIIVSDQNVENRENDYGNMSDDMIQNQQQDNNPKIKKKFSFGNN
eukprot:TRINITY_DN13093_c0_g1_i3.p1 TRINITY_DN13093_c0_g1~~TRINITY_DN13093_c0_g1_i3.p1  ORF type:complete len:280 (-),score=89.91 TRINITY_DN13093_c0_g1_i3:48-887(-)